jgi:HD-GYP domain-containing protein (c-di-GMP phosphodiesterase class II)
MFKNKKNNFNNTSILRMFYFAIFQIVVIVTTISYLIIHYHYKNLIDNKVSESVLSITKNLQYSDNNYNLDDIQASILKLYFENPRIDYIEYFNFNKNLHYIKDRKNTSMELIKELNGKYVKNGDYIYYIKDVGNMKILSIRIAISDIGVINVIAQLDESILKTAEEDKFNLLVFSYSILFIFILFIFPIIYLSYKKIDSNNKELLMSNFKTIIGLGNSIAKKDNETQEHNYRVTIYSVLLAEKMNFTKDQIKDLIIGALLHDVGKIGIPDNVLLKQGKLTESEYMIMKEHVSHGCDIVSDNSFLESAKKVIEFHHEKWGGNGYPYGLKGDLIPIEARVFAIVDVFDALLSKRPYKKEIKYEEAMEIISKSVEHHFDPSVYNIFAKNSYDFYISINYKNYDELKKILNEQLDKYYNIII